MLVESFIQNLVLTKPSVNIIEFAKRLNKILKNVDISFIEEFIELVGRTDFCIPHELLYKYGVLTENTTGHIKRLLEQNDFKELKDYQITKSIHGRNTDGTFTKNLYMLTPKAFKMCLIRSLKQQKYAEYYLFLEEVLTYYSEFQKLLLKQQITEAK